MFDIIKQIGAKATAIRYIESCESALHINSMRTYIDLYRKKYEDYLGYQELKGLLDDKVNLIFGK
jgi:hypothetical protein